MRNKAITDAISDVSYGLLTTSINLAISLVIFSDEFASAGTNPWKVMRAFEFANTFPHLDKDVLKRAVWRAKHQGLLKREHERGRDFWIATDQGRRKLTATLPVYFKKRPWNGRIYVVTYDVPENLHNQRTGLRKFLLQLGARRFQQSIYLILWDPTQLLRTFVEAHHLTGMVIVSDTGTDGSIGEKSLDELIWEVFELEALNQRYKDFLNTTERDKSKPAQLAFNYLSILADDPQLPFELLGPTWLGDKAYETIKTRLGEEPSSLFSSTRPGKLNVMLSSD